MSIQENRYKRLPNTNQFGIYYGIDDEGRKSLFVKLRRKPNLSHPGKYLIFASNRRTDDLWAFTVSIDDSKYEGVFKKLIYDLVDTVQSTSNSIVAERLFLQRFDEWKSLFNQRIEKKLDFAKTVGLAGELYFIQKFLIQKFGIISSIKGWSGPIGADKDFQIGQEWFEVKTKSLNKLTVHINSHTQLISQRNGFLVVIPYEKSSISNIHSMNLLDLYKNISDQIVDVDLQKEFDTKLANMDFVPHEEYREINLEFHNIEFYEVDKEFPKVSVSGNSNAIVGVEYDIFLPELQKFKIEE